MLPNVVLCGLCGQKIVFWVPPASPRRAKGNDWVLGLGTFVLCLLVVYRPVFGGLLLALICRGLSAGRRPRPVPQWEQIVLGRRALHFRGSVYQLSSAPIWVEDERVLVIVRRKSALRVDLGGVADGWRAEFVRHLEARKRLVRGPRRPNDHVVALEALYVFDAEAVLVRDHLARTVWPRGARWDAPAPGEEIFVREAVTVESSFSYRVSPPKVTALGDL